MKRNYFLLCAIFFLLSCEKDEPMWFDNQYVFLEQVTWGQNEVIQGEYYSHIEYDGAGWYQFSSSERTLGGTLWDSSDNWKTSEISGKTKMLFASETSDRGDVLGGYAAGMWEIHDFPYSNYQLTVKNIDEDGTVHIVYKDSSMSLSIDEEWSKLNTRMDTIIDWFDDWETHTTYWDTVIVKYTTQERLTNWGFLDKDQFSNWKDLWGQ